MTRLAPPAPLPADFLLSVLMPVYNERGTVREIVDRVQQVDIAKEIILVDDGSTDGTLDIIQMAKRLG